MKKLFINLTTAICAAAMLAVPSLSCSAAHTTNPKDLPTRSYFDSNNNYHRMVLGNTEGTPNKRYDVLVGDVNLDGEINFSDEVMISQYIINPEKYDFEKRISRVAADINGDGVVNNKDIKLVRSMGNKNIDPEDLVEKYIIDYFTDYASAESSTAYRVYYNTKTCEFSVILVGDTNGDKVINYSDNSQLSSTSEIRKVMHL